MSLPYEYRFLYYHQVLDSEGNSLVYNPSAREFRMKLFDGRVTMSPEELHELGGTLMETAKEAREMDKNYYTKEDINQTYNWIK